MELINFGEKRYQQCIEGIENIRKENEIQQRQRIQKYIDFAMRGLRPQGLKRKAPEKLFENPSIAWKQFVDHLVVKDLTFSVTTEFFELHD